MYLSDERLSMPPCLSSGFPRRPVFHSRYTQNVRHLVGLLALLCPLGLAAAELESIGIVGDSISTGALTGKGFTATSGALVGRTVRGHLEMAAPFATPGNTPVYNAYADPAEFNITRPVWPPTRLWMSHGEPPHIFRRTGSDRLRMMIIDTEQYSWGYLLGRKLGVMPRHIYLAARHGGGARELQYQFAALQMRDPAMPAMLPGHQPELVLVMMNLYEMCEFPGGFEQDPHYRRAFLDTYAQEFRGGFVAALEQIEPHPKGSAIVVMSPVDLLQSYRRDDLLDRRVPYEDAEVTCRDIRSGDLRPLRWMGRDLFEMSNICRGVLGIPWHAGERLDAIESLAREMVDIQRRVTLELAAHPPEGIRIAFIEETASIRFEAEDFAKDCWHPSLRGAEKIARTVHKALEENGIMNTLTSAAASPGSASRP
jgi:hypothetical protein